MKEKKQWEIIFFVFISSFLLRLINLKQSLWLDEGITARVVSEYSFSKIIYQFSPHDFHPPLYYLFVKIWTILFGNSEISLRLPSVIFSLIAGFFIYKIGILLKDKTTGKWAAIFFLFNPLIIYYSQEARMYMMATFFLTAALFYFFKLIKNDGKSKKKLFDRNILFFNFFSLLSFFTFYGSIFLIIPILLVFVYKKQTKNFLVSCFALLIGFIVVFPLFWQQMINARQSLTMVLNWKNILGKTSLKNLLLIPIKFSIGRIDFYPKWFYYFVAGLWTIFVWFFIFLFAFIKKKEDKKILVSLLFFPLFLGVIISFFTPLLQYFRFLYLIPIWGMILSLAVNNIKVFRNLIFIGLLIFSLIYLFIPKFHREDWKNLVTQLPKEKNIYMIYSSADALKYYKKDLKIIDLRVIKKFEGKEIIIIPYTAEIYGFNYEKILSKKYSLKTTKNFRGVFFEIWTDKAM